MSLRKRINERLRDSLDAESQSEKLISIDQEIERIEDRLEIAPPEEQDELEKLKQDLQSKRLEIIKELQDEESEEGESINENYIRKKAREFFRKNIFKESSFSEEEESEEEEQKSPAQGDIIIASDGNKLYVSEHEGGSKSFIGEFIDIDEALDVINKKMEKEGFYPQIWFVSDHGNLSPLDKEGNILDEVVDRDDEGESEEEKAIRDWGGADDPEEGKFDPEEFFGQASHQAQSDIEAEEGEEEYSSLGSFEDVDQFVKSLKSANKGEK